MSEAELWTRIFRVIPITVLALLILAWMRPGCVAGPVATHVDFDSPPRAGTPVQKQIETNGIAIPGLETPSVPAGHTPESAREVAQHSTNQYARGELDFKLLRSARRGSDGLPLFPESLRQWHGKEVSIIGFMAPYNSLSRMNIFMLLPYPVGCNFCAPPSRAEVALVRQSVKKDAPFMKGAIRVRGTLLLWREHPLKPGTAPDFLYSIDHATIEAYTADTRP